MKKTIIALIAATLLLFPSLTFAGEGEFTISTDLLDLNDDITSIIGEYAWSSELGIGLAYSGTSAVDTFMPYVRYYFSGDESSFYLGAGYYNSTVSGTSLSASGTVVEGGYNLDISMFTLDLGYALALSDNSDGEAHLKLGIFF